jgi:hypothetical protein
VSAGGGSVGDDGWLWNVIHEVSRWEKQTAGVEYVRCSVHHFTRRLFLRR